MKSVRVLVSITVVFGVLALVRSVLSQPVPPVPEPFTKHGPPKLPPADPRPPNRGLENTVKLTSVDDPDQQAIAELLQDQIDPSSRGDSFKPIIEREKFLVWGWQQEIVGVELRDGVQHVTIHVQPVVTQQNGRPVALTGATKDVYAVKGNKLVLVQTQAIGFPPAIFLD